ncbi:MAG: glycogen-binding domain-containing protein [Brevinema sp.]
MKNIVAFFLAVIAVPQVYAQSRMIEPEQVSIQRLLQDDSTNFRSPMILENSIVFFYQGQAREAFFAGEFNRWQPIPMKQEKSNLWVGVWTNRLSAGSYNYRFRVDGFWIADPSNPNFQFDARRQRLSIIQLDDMFVANKNYPLWISNNIYRFRYVNTNVRAAFIAGSFNNWNPYSLAMTYKGAGLFEADILLERKKIHLYSIVADGEWVLDDGNKQQYRSPQNRPVNGFFADQELSKP